MSCCGRQREQFLATRQAPLQASDRQRQPAFRFEYVGTTGLTVTGPLTGKRYRFDGYGSRVVIDPRDVPSMATVPHLRRV